MCNEYGNQVTYDQYIAAFSQVRLPLFVEGNGPDLSPRSGIHIRDTAPIIRRGGDGVELTELTWAPRDRNKKPVFNFRSEGRRLGVKKFGGEQVAPGNIILRQRGTQWHPGEGVGMGRDHTIFAEREGVVEFKTKARGRTYVSVRGGQAN